jgi:hypothetical protein
VPGDLDISNKGLARLPDLSTVRVGGGFYCDGNRLTSLEGAPRSVTGNFSCDNNRLTSLKGAPAAVGGGFSCYNNRLASLAHTPVKFLQLYSDFGTFGDWTEIPARLRAAPVIYPHEFHL